MTKGWYAGRAIFLALIIAVYIGAGIGFAALFDAGVLPRPVEENGLSELEPVERADSEAREALSAAKNYVNSELVRNQGHVDLYVSAGENASVADNRTNSEAVSYRLYWLAQSGEQEAFDEQLAFIEDRMLHPDYDYLMWRLEDDDRVVHDGENIASDADLRVISALLAAEQRWGDERYTALIDRIASGVEAVAITEDGHLAPYGGVAGKNDTWTANEVYLSYADFTVFDALAERRGEPWPSVRENTEAAYLDAQIYNGLYNPYLSPNRQYGNGIDGGGYSINNLWMMVRAAESGDPDLRASARNALSFYKERYSAAGELFPKYSSEGYAMSPSETPWAYALVARAATALGDREFAEKMVDELVSHQVSNESSRLHGAFPEGAGADRRVGQFTMQESIISLEAYVGKGSAPRRRTE